MAVRPAATSRRRRWVPLVIVLSVLLLGLGGYAVKHVVDDRNQTANDEKHVKAFVGEVERFMNTYNSLVESVPTVDVWAREGWPTHHAAAVLDLQTSIETMRGIREGIKDEEIREALLPVIESSVKRQRMFESLLANADTGEGYFERKEFLEDWWDRVRTVESDVQQTFRDLGRSLSIRDLE